MPLGKVCRATCLIISTHKSIAACMASASQARRNQNEVFRMTNNFPRARLESEKEADVATFSSLAKRAHTAFDECEAKRHD